MIVIILEMVNDSDGEVIMILITMIAMMIIIIIVMIILTIIMVEVLSNLQFNLHHKLPLESLSKWLKS